MGGGYAIITQFCPKLNWRLRIPRLTRVGRQEAGLQQPVVGLDRFLMLSRVVTGRSIFARKLILVQSSLHKKLPGQELRSALPAQKQILSALRLCGQEESGAQAAHGRVFEGDSSAVKFGEVADDGQSQARTGRGLVGAHSALQHRFAH